MSESGVRRGKAAFFSGCKSHSATIAPAGSNRSSHAGNEVAEPSDSVSRIGEPRLPLWVNLRHSQPCPECPKLGVKQTSILGDWMSACSHKRTLKACANVRTRSVLWYGEIPSAATRSALELPRDLSDQIWGTEKGTLPCAHASYVEITLVWSA